VLAAERRRRILDRIRGRGAVSVAELAAELDASEMTVRRDLREMAGDGLLLRTHGGAVRPEGYAHEPSYSEKSSLAADEKAAIARLAIELVHPGDSILLGPGTTTLALARLLAGIPELAVVTNSLLVANALVPASGVEVTLTGGMLRRSIHALVGPGAEESLRSVRSARAFISGNGLTAQRGLSTPSQLVASTDRAVAAAAQEVVVLADHTKLGQERMWQTVPIERIDVLITDSLAEPGELAALCEAGVDVRVARVSVESTMEIA
jgi:DeoR/GlpR family transcriptional regulator of sugar metabolism